MTYKVAEDRMDVDAGSVQETEKEAGGESGAAGKSKAGSDGGSESDSESEFEVDLDGEPDIEINESAYEVTEQAGLLHLAHGWIQRGNAKKVSKFQILFRRVVDRVVGSVLKRGYH